MRRALDALHAGGSAGAMLWCYADYAASLWGSPPLDQAPHERTFGVWHADGSEKDAVGAVRAFAGRSCVVREAATPSWIDIDPSAFYRGAEATELTRLYARYCDALR